MFKGRYKKVFTIKNAYIEGIYKDYYRYVNMGFKELLYWARNPYSRMGGGLSRRPLRHSLELLKTPKHKWNMKHVRFANRLIREIKRLKEVSNNKVLFKGCKYSKKYINLKNVGYDMRKK